MPPSELELMLDHVRAIHRSVTGAELPQTEAETRGDSPVPTFEDLTRRFSELEAMARSLPSVAERVPPFSFAPPLDVIGTERELWLELGAPGIDRADVEIKLDGGDLIVSGGRPSPTAIAGRVYFHAEMARGPFRRVIPLPEAISGPPRVEVDNGIIRIKLGRAVPAPLPRA
jgi:HSP20 family molecular chaperone IbpA